MNISKMNTSKNKQTPIYLDYAATTPVDPRVAAKISQFLTMEGIFGNPASNHHFGRDAKEAVEWAREQVANLIHAKPESIIWTSGATEANNLALKGAATFYQRHGKHIITAQTEHRAVLDSCQALARLGFEFTYLKPDKLGIIKKEAIQAAIRPDTILISIMHVNNETGVIQDIEGIGKMIKSMQDPVKDHVNDPVKDPVNEILFHVDAAQSVGKIPIDLAALPVDMMSFSAHKLYGPKGIGALYVRHFPKIRLIPQLDGGGQERGYRSGTLPTHQCIGMGEAFRIAREEMQNDYAHASRMREHFISAIAHLPDVIPNGDQSKSIPHILNLCFSSVEKDKILQEIENIAISSGSACTGSNLEASHVLRAMGLRNELADRSLRISFGRFTTEEEVTMASQQIQQAYLRYIKEAV